MSTKIQNNDGEIKRGKDHPRFKHGMSRAPIYRVWAAMITRCSDPKYKKYKYYGGRGITVCDRWLRFENFYEDMGERPSGLQIDRIDNDKGYSPDNCRWVTAKENNSVNKAEDNMPGKQFGNWLVLHLLENENRWRFHYYLCRCCKCGYETSRSGSQLRRMTGSLHPCRHANKIEQAQ